MPKKSRIKRAKKARYLIVLSTFPKRKDAETLAEGLIERRLAACCNLLPGLSSFFRWEGKRERAREFLLLIKTESRLFQEVQTFLKSHHPYELPECVALPIVAGDVSYLAWIKKSCR